MALIDTFFDRCSSLEPLVRLYSSNILACMYLNSVLILDGQERETVGLRQHVAHCVSFVPASSFCPTRRFLMPSLTSSNPAKYLRLKSA